MADRLFCPSCNKYSYSASAEVYSPCPYCGAIFSKVGPDRRVEKRFNCSANCKCQITEESSYTRNQFITDIEDISATGVKVKYPGELAITKKQVNLHVVKVNLNTEAKIKWVKTKNKTYTTAGLQFITPIPEQTLHQIL